MLFASQRLTSKLRAPVRLPFRRAIYTTEFLSPHCMRRFSCVFPRFYFAYRYFFFVGNENCLRRLIIGAFCCYNKYMKVFAVSDLHLGSCCDKPMDIFGDGWSGYWGNMREDWKNRVSDDDVVLIAGDISWAMRLEDALPDLRQIADLPGKKVILRGNHDYWWQSYQKLKDSLPSGIYAVQNNAVRIENLLVCGSRLWSLGAEGDHDKAMLKREEIRLRLALDDAKSQYKDGDKIVVMVHYPPFDVSFADSPFTAIISEYQVSAVVYGHLHGKDARVRRIVNKNGINYYLTSCDLIGYKPVELTDVFSGD